MCEKLPANKLMKKDIHSVLLIDDDSDEHALFATALRRFDAGIHCVTAYNCEQGYTLTRDEKPDAIFLDMNLPGTNGIACLRKLKKRHAFSDIPVFMYSCAALTSKEEVVFDIGAMGWIRKPTSFEAYDQMFANFFKA